MRSQQRMVRKGTRLTAVKVQGGLPSAGVLAEELQEYTDVLLGRRDAPVDGLSALLETATAYFARASEMNMLILELERDAQISKTHELVRFRTGELRTFRELASKAADLGSRRITAAQLEFDQSRQGRDIHASA